MSGLKAAGYSVTEFLPQGQINPSDVLVIWNRYGHYHDIALRFEGVGARVIVMENGYIGFDRLGRQFYSLALQGHNGSGKWFPRDDPSRLEQLGVTLAPWRAPTKDGHIVIRGQRGIGVAPMASPPDWHGFFARRLERVTQRRLKVVEHPGKTAVVDKAHEEYLKGAHALCVWASSVGVKALAMGVPVICDAPYWICKDAAFDLRDGIEEIDANLDAKDRLRVFTRMAWAQWSVDEIARGLPFVHLLRANTEERAVA